MTSIFEGEKKTLQNKARTSSKTRGPIGGSRIHSYKLNLETSREILSADGPRAKPYGVSYQPPKKWPEKNGFPRSF